MPISKSRLQEIILDQQYMCSMLERGAITPRDEVPKLLTLHDSPFIVILSGVRRCGKSTVLQVVRQQHLPADYYLNFDDDRLVHFSLADFQVLLELFIELFGEQNTFYFDEIQNVVGWERFIRRLHNQGKKVYLTGSNATMLSKELGTHLTGRHLLTIFSPFSFREYLAFYQYKIDSVHSLTTTQKGIIKRHFKTYVQEGGFPEFLQTKQPEYLKTLYENILYRDILARHHLPSEKILKELVYYLASHIGKDVSFNAIKNMLGVGSSTTIKDYVSYLEDAFLVFLVNQYHPSLKKQILAPKKIYFIDVAMAKMVGFRASEDRGRLLENLVYLELKRRKKEIYFHRDKKECDFLIREGTKITGAIQVCAELNALDTRKREYEGLLEAMDIYQLKEGLVLTEDEESREKHVIIKPIWKWLLE